MKNIIVYRVCSTESIIYGFGADFNEEILTQDKSEAMKYSIAYAAPLEKILISKKDGETLPEAFNKSYKSIWDKRYKRKFIFI